MLHQTTALLLIALVGDPQASMAADNSIWNVRTLRVEGAAAGVRRSAESVQDLANKISNTNNLQSLAQLQSQLDELHRLVVSARLSIEVASDELGMERP